MNYFYKKGFSLIEVMMAIGLLGVVSLGTMQLMKNVAVTSKTSEVSLEVNSVSNSIHQALINSEYCTNTLKNLGPIRNKLNVDEIINRTNNILFDTSTKYGNNQIKINKMELNGVNIKPLEPGFNRKFGELNFEVKMEKIGKGFNGQKLITKNFPLSAEFDINDNLIKCYSTTEKAIETAEEESCKGVGGSWIVATQTCNLNTNIGKDIAASTEDLNTKINDIKNVYLPATYVRKVGDTMTGALTINANLTAVDVRATNNLIATNNVCVGTKCRDFSLKRCNKDSILVGIQEDGNPICTPIVCPTGYYLERLDGSTGASTCKAIPTETCPLNQYVSEIRSNGTVTCSPLPPGLNQQCPQGQYVTRIAPNGTITCSNPNVNYLCSGNTLVSGFDENGKALCKSTSELKLKFNCNSYSTGYNDGNDDQYQQVDCTGNSLLSGITIYVSSYLDSIRSFKCCTPNVYWDPPEPAFPTPNTQLINYFSLNPGYNAGHDDQYAWFSCPAGKGMKYIRYWSGSYFEYFNEYTCAEPSLTNVPAGFSDHLTVGNCRSINLSSDDDQTQYANCSDDEVLFYTRYWISSYLDNMTDYQCCRVELQK